MGRCLRHGIALLLVVGLSLTAIAETPEDSYKAYADALRQEFEALGVPVLQEAFESVAAARRYRGTLTTETAVRSMLEGLVASLDDEYAAVVDLHEAGVAAGADSSRTADSGVILDVDRFGRLTVVSVLPGSPASRAGVRPGSRLLRIGTRNTAGMSPWEALPLLREVGSGPIRLTIAGDDGTPREVRLPRTAFAIQALTVRIGNVNRGIWHDSPTGKVAWIAVHAFVTPEMPDQWEQAVRTVWRSESVESIVFDVRDNGGGSNACLKALGDFFLGGDHLATFEAQVGDGGWTQEVWNDFVPRARLVSYPVAVLVNRRTASLAEIFAAALHEGRNAPLVGENTHGKGTTQTWITVADGYALHLTVGVWRTPDGRCIDGVGLRPDVAVRAPAPASPELVSSVHLEAAVRELDRRRGR